MCHNDFNIEFGTLENEKKSGNSENEGNNGKREKLFIGKSFLMEFGNVICFQKTAIKKLMRKFRLSKLTNWGKINQLGLNLKS